MSMSARFRRNRLATVRTEERVFVADRDYIPSGTADMWKTGRRRSAR